MEGFFFHLSSTWILEYKSNAMHRTPSNIEKRVGQKLRKQRRAHNYTLRDLSKRVEMDVSHLSKIERGLARTKLKTLERLAKALGLGIGELLSPAA